MWSRKVCIKLGLLKNVHYVMLILCILCNANCKIFEESQSMLRNRFQICLPTHTMLCTIGKNYRKTFLIIRKYFFYLFNNCVRRTDK